MARKYREETYQVAVGIGFWGWVKRIAIGLIILLVLVAIL
jgi:hypothetical protein